MHGRDDELVKGVTNLLQRIVFEEPRNVNVAPDQNAPFDLMVSQPILQGLTLMHVGAPIIGFSVFLVIPDHPAGQKFESGIRSQ